jgi:transcriptional regulator with XRE-family HTH domain
MRLRAIRAGPEKLGVSRERFATPAGVYRTYMSSIERGKVGVSVAVAAQVAAASGVPLSVLMRARTATASSASSSSS